MCCTRDFKMIQDIVQNDKGIFFHSFPISKKLKTSKYYKISKFSSERRRLSWAAGRECLYRTLLDCGENLPVEKIKWPHPQYSISHTDDIAIAVGVLPPSLGVGIDIEKKRSLNPKIKKFFINKDEEHYLSKIDLMTFWVIKESCYKADPENSKRFLKSYFIVDIQEHSALLKCKDELNISYEARWGQWKDYFLSVALRKLKP